MSVMESMAVALFCMSMVFAVLVFLYLILLVLSRLLGIRTVSKTDMKNSAELAGSEQQNWDVEAAHISSGELKLINVDEKTAAMIIAIVSDESQIPLSELRFKSIRAIEQDS